MGKINSSGHYEQVPDCYCDTFRTISTIAGFREYYVDFCSPKCSTAKGHKQLFYEWILNQHAPNRKKYYLFRETRSRLQMFRYLEQVLKVSPKVRYLKGKNHNIYTILSLDKIPPPAKRINKKKALKIFGDNHEVGFATGHSKFSSILLSQGLEGKTDETTDISTYLNKESLVACFIPKWLKRAIEKRFGKKPVSGSPNPLTGILRPGIKCLINDKTWERMSDEEKAKLYLRLQEKGMWQATKVGKKFIANYLPTKADYAGTDLLISDYFISPEAHD